MQQKEEMEMGVPYTPENDRVIVMLCELGTDYGAIAERLGRTRAGIEKRVAYLRKRRGVSVVAMTQKEKDRHVCDVLNTIIAALTAADNSDASPEYVARMANEVYQALRDKGYILTDREHDRAA